DAPSFACEHARGGLPHGIVDGATAYCGWRDACLVVVDVADRANPKLITHQRWFPPIGGGTHNTLPLPERELLIVLDEAVLDEVADGYKPIWGFDNKIKRAPGCISTLPMPIDPDYIAVGGPFGPPHVHEKQPA